MNTVTTVILAGLMLVASGLVQAGEMDWSEVKGSGPQVCHNEVVFDKDYGISLEIVCVSVEEFNAQDR